VSRGHSRLPDRPKDTNMYTKGQYTKRLSYNG
jgi:hypothetical protein